MQEGGQLPTLSCRVPVKWDMRSRQRTIATLLLLMATSIAVKPLQIQASLGHTSSRCLPTLPPLVESRAINYRLLR